ncbi:MAG: DUF721 domain-containing protein [Ignavibacteriaceae bacterium]|jgi:hypothetical protein
MRSLKVKSLAELLASEPGLRKINAFVKENEVIEKFYEIFPAFEKIVEPQKIERKVLLLKVENPAWRNELFLQKEKLVEKINEFFGEKRINYLKLIG